MDLNAFSLFLMKESKPTVKKERKKEISERKESNKK
jgi:hypothetical protein